MQSYRVRRFWIIFLLSALLLAALSYYRSFDKAPTPEIVKEEIPVSYPTQQYHLPLNTVNKKATIEDAMRDAEQVAKAIGMNENNIALARQNAKRLTQKYLRPYSD